MHLRVKAFQGFRKLNIDLSVTGHDWYFETNSLVTGN